MAKNVTIIQWLKQETLFNQLRLWSTVVNLILMGKFVFPEPHFASQYFAIWEGGGREKIQNNIGGG